MPFLSNNRKPQDAMGERTAEEREAARLERQRRREAHRGDAALTDLSHPVDDPPAQPLADVQEPAPAPVMDPEPTPPPQPQAVSEPAPEPVVEQSAEPELAQPQEELVQHHVQEDIPVDEPPAPLEPASAARGHHHRFPRLHARHASHRDSLLERRKARLREHRKRQGVHVRGFTRARLGASLALLAAIALLWFLFSLFQPFHGAGHGRVIVSIPAKSSSSEIASILARDGVVSSSFFFELRATIEGKRSDLHSGSFQLQRDMSYSAAIEALSKPPPAQIPVSVLIPEGENRMQIAELASADGLTGSYLQASARSPGLETAHYGAPRKTASLEGFLFPATYDLVAGAPVTRLVAAQLAAFRENFGSLQIARARALHVTPYQLLIIASMIEREAKTPGDRAKISAVIYNRLRDGIALGIDATTYYGIELQKGVSTYTGELTEAELHSDSPYNTRTRRGLPPTPISNPGAASIHAAAFPAHASYLYYVLSADGCGEHVFSSTAAAFERNAAAYQQAVTKNAGKPPVCKKK
jgi:uncharacterized YceG family protein